MDDASKFEPIVREKRNLKVLKVIAVLIVLLVVIAGAFWYVQMYYPGLIVTTPEESLDGVAWGDVDQIDGASQAKLNEAYNQIITSYKEQPFVFRVVPDASNRIAVKAPSADNLRDITDYQSRVAQLSPNDKAQAMQDNLESFTFEDGQTFSDGVDMHPQAAILYQMQDEIFYLAHEINARYAIPAFKDRAKEVELVTVPLNDPFDQTVVLTYPGGRAVNAFMMAAIMSRLDSANAELYLANAQAFAERGVMYGEYSVSDLEIAKSLVEQYFVLVDFEIESGLEITW